MTNIGTGVAIGGLTGVSLCVAEAITGASTVGIKEAIGIGVFSGSIVWWLGRKFQSIDDSFKAVNEELANIRKKLEIKNPPK
jgi:hypothetical protein